MGAHDISLDLKGKLSKAEISAAFTAQREDDSQENGHQSGYSGDFQTVHHVDFHLDKVFLSENEAMEYCLKHAKKWESVVAVYYNRSTPVKSKALDKLNDKYKTLFAEREKLDLPPKWDATFKTCSKCKSRLATAHIKRSCPLCSTDLRSKALLNKIVRIDAKMIELKEKAKAIKDKENAKQAAKGTNVNTLLAGWGAS